MWWFAAAHANLLLLYERVAQPAVRGARMLDAGCGTGGLLRRHACRYPDSAAIGIDIAPLACGRARVKSGSPVCAGSVDALPFADGSFAAIFSADVLCHRAVNERAALAQFHRCLNPGGLLVLNLPAYRWMMSHHDAAVHNARRYTRRGLAILLRAANFRPLYSGYWNTVLFPLMLARRKFRSAGCGGGSDVGLYPRPVEALCRAATGIERLWLKRGMRLPFGGSVVAVAVKAEGSDA